MKLQHLYCYTLQQRMALQSSQR